MPSYNFTIDDISPVITYQGSWVDSNHSDVQFFKYFNSTFHATKSPETSASFAFNGTGVHLFGAMRDNHGPYSVSIDGQVVATPNGAGVNQFQQLLYGTYDLPWGLHHVILSNTGAPSFVDLDFVTITTGDGKTDTVSQDTIIDDAAFSYDASWTNGTNGLDAGLGVHRTETPNAVARIPFHGNAIKLYGTTDTDHGMFNVSLDNAPPITVNGTAPVNRPDTLLCQFDGLPVGDHVLVVENLSNDVLDLNRAVVSAYVAAPAGGSASTAQNGPVPKGSTSITSQTGTLIGLIVGSLVLLSLIAVGLYLLLRTRKATHERRHGGARVLKELEAEMDVGDLSDIPAPRLFVNPFNEPEAPPPCYEPSATASSSRGSFSMSPSTASGWAPDRKRRPTLPEIAVPLHSGLGEYTASVYSSSQHSHYAPSAAGGSRF